MSRQKALSVVVTALALVCGSVRGAKSAPLAPPQTNAKAAFDCLITMEVYQKPDLDTADVRGHIEDKKVTHPLQTGEPVWVKLTIRNRGTEAVSFDETHPANDFQVLVRAPDGSQATLTGAGKLYEKAKETSKDKAERSRTGRTVKPGGAISTYFQVNLLYDMTVGGVYTITATRLAEHYDAPVRSKLWVKIESSSASLRTDIYGYSGNF